MALRQHFANIKPFTKSNESIAQKKCKDSYSPGSK